MSTAAVSGNFLGENILVLESVVNCKCPRKAGRAGECLKRSIGKCRASERLWWLPWIHTSSPSPSLFLHPGGYVEMHSKDNHKYEVLRKHHWEWVRMGTGGGAGQWEPLTKLKLCIQLSRAVSQAMRWDQLSNVRSHVISCETDIGMLSQIGDRRAPAFSTLLRAIGFAMLGRSFLRIDSRTKRRECLLEYTKFWVDGVNQFNGTIFWNCICTAHSKKGNLVLAMF